MVQVFALQIDTSAILLRQTVTVVNRRWAALIVLSDTSELRNEIVGFTDGILGIGNLLHFLFERRRQKSSSILFVESLFGGVLLKIVF